MKLPDPGDQNSKGHSDSILIEEIRTLADRKGALILAHNYQIPGIYAIAEKIGESLELARAAQETDTSMIIFCGVDFMADTAKFLNPDSYVLNPDPEARCTMAHMAGEDEVERMKKGNRELRWSVFT